MFMHIIHRSTCGRGATTSVGRSNIWTISKKWMPAWTSPALVCASTKAVEHQRSVRFDMIPHVSFLFHHTLFAASVTFRHFNLLFQTFSKWCRATKCQEPARWMHSWAPVSRSPRASRRPSTDQSTEKNWTRAIRGKWSLISILHLIYVVFRCLNIWLLPLLLVYIKKGMKILRWASTASSILVSGARSAVRNTIQVSNGDTSTWKMLSLWTRVCSGQGDLFMYLTAISLISLLLNL